MSENSGINILQLSDLHIMATPAGRLLGVDTEYYFRACLELGMCSSPEQGGWDLVLLTGDLAQEPCMASYQRIASYLEKYDLPCLALPGNHDDYGLMQQVLNNDRVGCLRQRLFGNWQLIGLNSQIPGESGGDLANDELLFLRQCLEAESNRHALIAMHHHCWPTQSPWVDCMIIKNSQDFLDLITSFPQVKAVVFGHVHQEMEVMMQGVRLLATPSTCFQFSPVTPELSLCDTAPGCRAITLHADGRVDSRIIRLPNSLVGLQSTTLGY